VEWSAERLSHGTIFRQSKSNDRFILDLINIYMCRVYLSLIVPVYYVLLVGEQ